MAVNWIKAGYFKEGRCYVKCYLEVNCLITLHSCQLEQTVIGIYGMVLAKMGFSSINCARKILAAMCSRMCKKSLKKARFKMGFDGENIKFNAEFIWNNILTKWMAVLVQHCAILFRLTLEDIFMLNMCDLTASVNVLWGFHCILIFLRSQTF